MDKFHRILAAVAAVLLLLVLLGGLVYTCVVANKSGAWPVYVFLGVLLIFGWDTIFGTFKWLVERALGK